MYRRATGELIIPRDILQIEFRKRLLHRFDKSMCDVTVDIEIVVPGTSIDAHLEDIANIKAAAVT